MKIENIYIGTWIPRASIHLKEIYKFLDSGESFVKDLDPKKIKALKENLLIDKIEFIKDKKIDDTLKNTLIKKANDLGFDMSKLIFVNQE